MDRQGLVFELTDKMHRGQYLDYFSQRLGFSKCVGFNGNLLKIVFADSVVFSTADDYMFALIFLVTIRWLTGKKSVAIFIRAENSVSGRTLKQFIKLCVFKYYMLVPKNRVFSIMPHYAYSGLEKVTDSYIYDPAFFNENQLVGMPECGDVDLVGRIKSDSEGKSICLYVGNICKDRGLLSYLELARTTISLSHDWLFVVVGNYVEEGVDFKDLLKEKNFVFYGEKVAKETFDFLLEKAGVVWCAHAIKYDQSSGVFCNSVRMGKRILVRRGAGISRIFREENVEGDNLSLPENVCCSRYHYSDEIHVENEKFNVRQLRWVIE